MELTTICVGIVIWIILSIVTIIFACFFLVGSATMTTNSGLYYL